VSLTREICRRCCQDITAPGNQAKANEDHKLVCTGTPIATTFLKSQDGKAR
jgi:hypothetical protein